MKIIIIILANVQFLIYLMASAFAQPLCIPYLTCLGIEAINFNYLFECGSTNSIDSLLASLANIPIEFTPETPDQIDPDFMLFTRNNINNPQIYNYNFQLKDGSNQTTYFLTAKETKFIIHGFFDSVNATTWMQQIKNYILLKLDCNVFIVNWPKGAEFVNYFQSAANTRTIGATVANVIYQLNIAFNITTNSVHLIGHSLGAHACGFAGAYVQLYNIGRINRISGLDPAGPGFTCTDPSTRLDKTDANLVVMMHTNAFLITPQGQIGFFGLYDAIGHYDFYPNGGSIQSGCTILGTPTDLLEALLTVYTPNGTTAEGIFLGCSHFRATVLPPADPSLVNSTCQSVGYNSDSYNDYLNGNVDVFSTGDSPKPLEFFFYGNSSEPYFWENSANYIVGDNKTPEVLYIITSANTPYCLFQYQVVVHISGSSSVSGTLSVTIRGNTVNIPTNSANGFTGGQNYTSLLAVEPDLGIISCASVQWTANPLSVILGALSLFPRPPSISIDTIYFNYMSNIDDSVRISKSSALSPVSGQVITSGSSAQFGNCKN